MVAVSRFFFWVSRYPWFRHMLSVCIQMQLASIPDICSPPAVIGKSSCERYANCERALIAWIGWNGNSVNSLWASFAFVCLNLVFYTFVSHFKYISVPFASTFCRNVFWPNDFANTFSRIKSTSSAEHHRTLQMSYVKASVLYESPTIGVLIMKTSWARLNVVLLN